MQLYLVLTTKNCKSISLFLQVINKILKKNSFLVLPFGKFYRSKSIKKKVTVLKSPHVNKSAKESFFFLYSKTVIVLHSLDFRKDLFLLKYLNDRFFFDIQLKVRITLTKKNTLNQYKSNPNQLLLKKKLLNIFDVFGENCFTNTTI